MRGNIYAANEVKGRDRYSRDRTQRVSRDGSGLLGCVVAVQGRCLPGLYLAATVTSPFGILLTAVRRRSALFLLSPANSDASGGHSNYTVGYHSDVCENSPT
jgi:hypothetical protein